MVRISLVMMILKMFVYHPKFSTLVLKEGKSSEYVIIWKSKGSFESKIPVLNNAFLLKIKRFEYKIGIQFNKITLVIDKNNYAAKIVNVFLSMI